MQLRSRYHNTRLALPRKTAGYLICLWYQKYVVYLGNWTVGAHMPLCKCSSSSASSDSLAGDIFHKMSSTKAYPFIFSTSHYQFFSSLSYSECYSKKHPGNPAQLVIHTTLVKTLWTEILDLPFLVEACLRHLQVFTPYLSGAKFL